MKHIKRFDECPGCCLVHQPAKIETYKHMPKLKHCLYCQSVFGTVDNITDCDTALKTIGKNAECETSYFDLYIADSETFIHGWVSGTGEIVQYG